MTESYVTWTFAILNLDEPGPPRNLTNGTITDTSIVVKWEAPIFDGNSPINNYTVRYKLENSITNMVNVTNNTSINLIDLSPAKAYLIYVSANNIHFLGSENQITLVTANPGMILHPLWRLYHYTMVVDTYVGIHYWYILGILEVKFIRLVLTRYI